jgi:hypothetical protein
MKHVLVAIVATTIGLGAALPAIAQDTTSSEPPAATTPAPTGESQATPVRPDRNQFRLMLRNNMAMRHGGGILSLACTPNGAEQLEIALVRLSYRLDLTDTQKPLFDTFRTKALSTATNFADACKAAMPDRAAGPPDLLAQVKATLSIDEARVAALQAVLPDFEALYNTLTDAQKLALTPGAGHHRLDRQWRPAAPGRG